MLLPVIGDSSARASLDAATLPLFAHTYHRHHHHCRLLSSYRHTEPEELENAMPIVG